MDKTIAPELAWLKDLAIVYRENGRLAYVRIIDWYLLSYLAFLGEEFNPEREARQDFGYDFVRIAHIDSARVMTGEVQK